MAEPQDLAQLLQAIEALPDAVTLELRALAWRASRYAKDRASAILLSKRHAPVTAASIEIVEDAANRQFVVHAAGDPNRPANLPRWLEYGTRVQAATPFMRPAADETNAVFSKQIEGVVEKLLRERLGA